MRSTGAESSATVTTARDGAHAAPALTHRARGARIGRGSTSGRGRGGIRGGRRHGIPARHAARPLPRSLRRVARGATAPLARGARAVRVVRSRLPLAVRGALQLRPDLGAPRRLGVLGPLRRRPPLRRARLRRQPPRPRGRRSRLLRRRAQGARTLRAVGAARRGAAHRGAGAAPGRPEAAPEARGPARLPPQPGQPHAAVREARGQGARRAPDSGDAVRHALDRRFRRGPVLVARARLGREGLLRDAGAAGAHRRGRGRAHARSRRRGAGRGRHRVARQRRAARGLEPGLHRLGPGLPRRRHPGRLRAVESDGVGDAP